MVGCSRHQRKNPKQRDKIVKIFLLKCKKIENRNKIKKTKFLVLRHLKFIKQLLCQRESTLKLQNFWKTTSKPHWIQLKKCLGEGTGNPLQYSCLENPLNRGAWRAAVHRVAQSCTWLKQLSSTHALEREMATHFSILAWRILGSEEPGGLPSMRSHRVGHDWSNLAAVAKKCLEEYHSYGTTEKKYRIKIIKV